MVHSFRLDALAVADGAPHFEITLRDSPAGGVGSRQSRPVDAAVAAGVS